MLSLLCPAQQSREQGVGAGVGAACNGRDTTTHFKERAGLNWPLSCKFTGLHQRFTAWLTVPGTGPACRALEMGLGAGMDWGTRSGLL